VLAADLAPADVEHGSLAVAHLRAGELVGLEDGDELVDARRALEPEPLDVLEVAERRSR